MSVDLAAGIKAVRKGKGSGFWIEVLGFWGYLRKLRVCNACTCWVCSLGAFVFQVHALDSDVGFRLEFRL